MDVRCDGLRFGLLGAPAVYDAEGEPQPVQSAKGRALLAALLLEPGRAVSVDALKDALWGGAPPASAHASLQNHVTRLRRLLDDPERLRAVPPGYRLRVADGELDVRVFEQLVAQARAAYAERDWDGCAAAAAGALSLWRGTPLGGLPADATGHALVPRLEEARLLALELRYDAELAIGAGGGGGLVPELAELVAEYPLRETFHRQLMLVLHRTGRQAEALAVHRELRRRLVEELGVEPGASVRAAHREVLREPAGVGLAGAVGGGAVGAAAPVAAVGGVGAAAPVVAVAAVGGVAPAAPVAPAASAGAVAPVVGSVGVGSAGRELGPASPAGSAGRESGLAGLAGSAGRDLAAVAGPGPGSGLGSGLGSTAGSGPGPEAGAGPGLAVSAAAASPSPAVHAGSGVAAPVSSSPAAPVGQGPATPGLAVSAAAASPSPAVHAGPGGAAPVSSSPAAPVGQGPATPVGPSPAASAGPGVAAPASPVPATPAAPAPEEPPAPGPDAATPAAHAPPASPPPPTATLTPTPIRPAQLPPSPPHFTGREEVVRSLAQLLAGPLPTGAGGSGGVLGKVAGSAPPVAVLSGMAGVGKSALALHVAHRLREHFPDGQLYVNLRGATPGMTPLTSDQALAALLRDLGVESSNSPEHPDAAAALLRSLLAPTRTLLVLDDAATAAQLRPLLPAGSGCAVIVTSRSPLTALDGAGRFPLEPLSEGDSVALLRAASGRAGLDAGHPLVELAGRLPLALRIIAARLAARRALTPDALAELLTVSGGRLHHLEHDDLSVRRSLAVALDALRTSERESDRDAAAALAAIGALDLPAYGVPLLASLLEVEEWRAGAALDRLVDVALLDETAYGRYAPHDLVRDFAREAAHQGGPGAAAVDVVESALQWYAEAARQTVLAIMPEGLDRDDRLRGVDERLPPRRRADRAADGSLASAVPAVPAVPAMSTDDAFAWGDTELTNVIALADRHGRESVLLPVLVRCFFSYLKRRGRLAEADLLNRLAVTAARRWSDTASEAQALTDLAGLNYVSGHSDTALALIDEALTLWRELDLVSFVHRAVLNRSLLLEALGRFEESAQALHQSLELAKDLDDPLSEAFALSHLGNIYEHSDVRTALDYHERSLAIGETLAHAGVRQEAHCDIGHAHLLLGEPAVALTHFEESLRIHGEAEDWHNESKVRLGVVRALRELCRTQDATRECADLLERAEQRADAHMAGLARHQHGLLLYAQGCAEEAYAQWRSALAALDGTDSSEVVGELKNLLAG
ncbi:BTAD domain-containing putative transcriptional regulator [Streptomyces sp. NPDC057302]|uniref:BTAD domain-containing putative transcriptional regulator n=1 Tax=Streptomyces sp. NPDC057302 TaxID=3346094 RepID=UPI00363292FA